MAGHHSLIIEADLAWTGQRFERGIRIAVGDDGVILDVGSLKQSPHRQLVNRAILPGMINVHSHAFQRGLRGWGETFPQGAGSFWTWREAMYRLVESMDEASLHRLAIQAFREMLAAGITTVGEFHYLHHDSREAGFVFDQVMLRAAREAGIRIALLECYYRTGGINQPLAGGQRRFHTQSIEEYWAQFDCLKSIIEPSTQSLGVAPHSIRAAPIEEISQLHQEACKRGLVFHMHVEEQPKEIEDCLDRYGKTPMALLNQHLQVNPMFTAVHCTHTAAADMEEYLAHGGNVCINPLTEGNLGDGIPATARILRKGGRICLGSDSNARICWTEEMRWLEYGQRLLTKQRGLCADDSGNVASRLFEMATINGARSLGVKAGRIQAGHAADFFTIDLTAPILDGWDEATLLESFIFGTGNEAIREVCVGGRWIAKTGD